MTLGNLPARASRSGDHSGILRNIIIVNFFFRIFSEGFRTLFVPFSYDILGLSSAQYGLIQSLGGYAAMAVVFFLGIIVDIQFKKVTMIIGIISSLFSALLFPRVRIYGLSIFFWCLFSIGQLMMMISTNAFIANETKKGEQRTAGFSWNMIARGLASIIAPISFTALYDLTALNYNWIYLIMGSFGLVAGVLVIFLKLIVEETPKEEIRYAQELSEKSGDDFTQFSDEKKKRSVWLVQLSFGAGRMLMGFASGIAIPFVGLYMYSQFNLTEIQWGLLNSINWIVLTSGYFFMSFIAERVGKGLIVVIYWTLVIPAALGITLAGRAGLFYLTATFFIVRYLFAMTPSAAWNSFLFEWIPPKHRGKILGMIQTGQRGLRATGTLVGGYVFDAIGAAIFPVAMIAYPIAGLLPMIISKTVKKKESEKGEIELSKESIAESLETEVLIDEPQQVAK